MNEILDSSVHSAKFMLGDLVDAMAKASPLEALVLQPMIQDAVKLVHGIEALIEARKAQ